MAAVLVGYRAYLIDERGLAAESVRCYLLDASAFLRSCPARSESALAGLSAGQVTGFFVAYCRDRNVWSAKAMVTGVRSFLRYLHVAGLVPVSLIGRSRRWRVGGERRCPAVWTAVQVQATACQLRSGDRGRAP